MKAKRVLSLLLTVAMVATIVSAFGMTAFAAPEGYEDYVQNGTSAAFFKEDQARAGVAPDPNGVIMNFDVQAMTAKEVCEYFGVAEAEFDDLGYEVPSEWKDYGYMVTVSMENLGTLVKSSKKVGAKTNYSGYAISDINFVLSSDDEYLFCDFLETDLYEDANDADYFKNANDKDAKTIKFEFYGTSAKSSYPQSTGTIENASVENVVTFLIYAKPGTVLKVNDPTYASLASGVVLLNNYNADKQTGTDGAEFLTDTFAYWHPETITLGTAEEPEKEPVIDNVVTGDTSGVEIINGDRTGKKYDNAFATSASFSNAGSITGAGVLFIPEVVLGSNELTVETATVANAYKEGAFLGEGAYTIKAAIRNIPSGLAGTDIKMVVRPYILKDDAYTYGTAATATVNFTVTGE